MKHSVGDKQKFFIRLNEPYYFLLHLIWRLLRFFDAIYKTDKTFLKKYYQSLHNKHNHFQLQYANIRHINICQRKIFIATIINSLLSLSPNLCLLTCRVLFLLIENPNIYIYIMKVQKCAIQGIWKRNEKISH